MEQIIKIFENEKFGRIRTITKDGEPWFVIADVCSCLLYTSDAADEL